MSLMTLLVKRRNWGPWKVSQELLAEPKQASRFPAILYSFYQEKLACYPYFYLAV